MAVEFVGAPVVKHLTLPESSHLESLRNEQYFQQTLNQFGVSYLHPRTLLFDQRRIYLGRGDVDLLKVLSKSPNWALSPEAAFEEFGGIVWRKRGRNRVHRLNRKLATVDGFPFQIKNVNTYEYQIVPQRQLSADAFLPLQRQQIVASLDLAGALTQEIGRKPTISEIQDQVRKILESVGYNRGEYTFQTFAEACLKLGIEQLTPDSVNINGQRIKINLTDYYLLRELILHADSVVKNQQLLNILNRNIRPQVIKLYMGRLRKKLAASPTELIFKISNVRGKGYLLTMPSGDAASDQKEYLQS